MGGMDKLIITAAICGAEVTKDQNPAVPYSADELAEEARRAQDAGAAIIHLHVRDGSGNPTQDRETFRRAIEAIRRAGVTAIIQPSTGGAAGMSGDERLQPVELNPEMASLDCGTLNFGDAIFVNDLPLMRRFAAAMQERRIVPELECFEAGHIGYAKKLAAEGLLPDHLHFNLVLGVPGGAPADLTTLMYMLSLLPPGASWTCSALGRQQLPMGIHTMVLGGHVRVGFEDNIYYRKGEPAQSNGQLVARMVRMASEAGRPVATPDEARRILGIRRHG
jgi:3-keto-5-aminohexanoate cleavage enzyme